MSPSETADADDRHALAFRIAVTAAAGFTLGHLLGWDFPFLPSLLAVQLLSARRNSRSDARPRLCAAHGGRLRRQSLRCPDLCRPSAELDPHRGTLDLCRVLGFGARPGGSRDLSHDHVFRAANGCELARSRLRAGLRADRRQHSCVAADLPCPCVVPRERRFAASGGPGHKGGRSARRCARQYRRADDPVRLFHGYGNPDQHHRDHGHRHHRSSTIGCRWPRRNFRDSSPETSPADLPRRSPTS